MTFDPAKLGLESSYTQDQRNTIKRFILEERKSSKVKLPTYMKQIAQTISVDKVPDEWLKKLSHQTMSKMLRNTSTPRDEFWACLHLYLIKKHGDIGISTANISILDNLGKLLMRFGQATSSHLVAGTYRLYESTAIKLADGSGFQRIVVIHRKEAIDEMNDPVYTAYEGAAITRDEKVFAVIRHMRTRALSHVETQLDELPDLIDPAMTERLNQLMEDV